MKQVAVFLLVFALPAYSDECARMVTLASTQVPGPYAPPPPTAIASFSQAMRGAGVRYLLLTVSQKRYLQAAAQHSTRDAVLTALLKSHKTVTLTPLWDQDRGRHAAPLLNLGELTRRDGVDYYYDNQWHVGFILPVELLDQVGFQVDVVTMQGAPVQLQSENFRPDQLFQLAGVAAAFERYPESEYPKRHRIRPNDNIFFTLNAAQKLPETFHSLLWLPAPLIRTLDSAWKDFPGAGHTLIPLAGAPLHVRIVVEDPEGYLGLASAPLATVDETERFFDGAMGFGTWFYYLPDWRIVEKNVLKWESPSYPWIPYYPENANTITALSEEAYAGGRKSKDIWNQLRAAGRLASEVAAQSDRQKTIASIAHALQYLKARYAGKVFAEPEQVVSLIESELAGEEALTISRLTSALNRLRKAILIDERVEQAVVVGDRLTDGDPFLNSLPKTLAEKITPSSLNPPSSKTVKLVWLLRLDKQDAVIGARLAISGGMSSSRRSLYLLDTQAEGLRSPLKLASFERLKGFVNPDGLHYGGFESPVFVSADTPEERFAVGAVIALGEEAHDALGVSPHDWQTPIQELFR